jgi:hypothetical protein
MRKAIKHNYRILAHLLKGLVSERFKRMAKDEVLFKFLSKRLEPAVLIDHYLQADREAMDLAEMSLLELVNSERLENELQKSAEKIQKNFQRMFGEQGAEYVTKNLVEKRAEWLSTRVEFYRRMLSLSQECENPIQLGATAFRNQKRFADYLRPVSQSDREFAEAIVSHTEPLNRFLMKKHMDYELQNSENLWNEFADEIFKKIPQLTE